MLANSRTPDERAGDLDAQVGANVSGVRRLAAHATDPLEEAVAYGERRMRAAIADLPDGEWTATDVLDSTGAADAQQRPVTIRCTITVDGSSMRVDFAGTDAQTAGNVNAVAAVTVSSVAYAVRTIVDPTMPANGGALVPVEIVVPDATVVSAEAPAAVGAGNVEVSQRVADVVLAALAQAVPERVGAADQGTMNNVLIGGAGWVYYETVAGGQGGRPGSGPDGTAGARPGQSGIHTAMTNTMNTPIEALERTFPLRVLRYRLRRGSGGAGLAPGGEGIERDLQVLEDVTVSLITERRVSRPWGLAGGEPGASGENWLLPQGDEERAERLPDKCTIQLRARRRPANAHAGGWRLGSPRRRTNRGAMIEHDEHDPVGGREPGRWNVRRSGKIGPVKSLGFILSYLGTQQARRSARILGWMVGLLTLIVAVYSVLFHEIMDHEGQSYSWITAIYWTLVTMSTLGFGDITFESDLGRAFSVVVLLSGSVFILVLLPFTFIQFVFVPWMESTQRARAPRRVDDDVRDHVVLTGTGAIEAALVGRLDRAGIPYVTLVADLDEALRLNDEGWSVVVGSLDDPGVYRAVGIERAAMVATTRADTTNTNVAFTVREITEALTIVATADSDASVDILELAGCDEVLRLGEMLGTALARRVLAPDGRSQVIGDFDQLLIAEAAAPAPLVGRPLADSELRQRTGLTVGGVWERGTLHVARPTTVLQPSSILVLAGSREQLDRYDALFAVVQEPSGAVVIIGGGRVGRAVARHLEREGVDHRIVEKQADRPHDPDRYVVGDAADLHVLKEAGIEEASAVVVTTHDDDMNIYLTNYCRRLRSDIQIIARSRLDRNVSTLHRAGADSVLSYSSIGSNAMWNILTADNTLQLAEGLDVFRASTPAELVGVPIAQASIREATGCTVVAVASDERFEANPDPNAPLTAGTELVVIGDEESEHRFLTRYRAKS